MTSPTTHTALNGLAAVCSVSKSNRGGLHNITYVMPVEDAKVFCQQPETAGQNFMFVWEALHKFVDEKTNRIPPRTFKKDDGRFDAMIARLGLTAVNKDTIAY